MFGLHVCLRYAHAVLPVARRGSQILWDCSSRRLRISMWVLRLNLGALQEQQVLLIACSSPQPSILCFAKLHAERIWRPHLDQLFPFCSSRKHKSRRGSNGRDLGNSSLQETYDRRDLRVGTLDKWILCPVYKPCAELYVHLYLHSSSHWSPKPEPGVTPSCCGHLSSQDTSCILK